MQDVCGTVGLLNGSISILLQIKIYRFGYSATKGYLCFSCNVFVVRLENGMPGLKMIHWGSVTVGHVPKAQYQEMKKGLAFYGSPLTLYSMYGRTVALTSATLSRCSCVSWW